MPEKLGHGNALRDGNFQYGVVDMTEQTEAPLQVSINAQYIKDLSFENPNAPQVFSQTSTAPELNMGVNVQTRVLAENVYEVVLFLRLEAQIEGKAAFIAELAYGGAFTMPKMPEEHLKVFLLVEGPRMLFPFARNIMANAVRDGGFPQILINPIDFAAMYNAQQAQAAQMPAGNA